MMRFTDCVPNDRHAVTDHRQPAWIRLRARHLFATRKEAGGPGLVTWFNWGAVWSGSLSQQRRLQLFLLSSPKIHFRLQISSCVLLYLVSVSLFPPSSTVCSTQPAGRSEASEPAAARRQQRHERGGGGGERKEVSL